MRYEEREASSDRSRPIELYKFSSPYKNYYYTSSASDCLFQGETYHPVYIIRGDTKVFSGSASENKVSIEIQNDSDLVREFGFTGFQPSNLILTLYRYHEADDPEAEHAVIYNGAVTSIKAGESVSRINAVNKYSNFLKRTLPNVYYQNFCNHVLYDGGCGADPLDFSGSAVVEEVSGVNLVLIAGVSDGARYNGGTVRIVRNNEVRTIVSLDYSRLEVNFPFLDVKADDELTLIMGCDHSFETCRSKFNNHKRFGGFPFIPKANVFEEDF